MGARMVPENGQTTKTKKSFVCRFGWKDFPSYYKYIHSRAILFSKRGGGGACFYWVACFYWDIYGRWIKQSSKICIASN